MTDLEKAEAEADYQADKSRDEIRARRYATGLLVFAWCIIGTMGALIVAGLWGLASIMPRWI